jgi:GT2 family glycosyltransferase
MLARRAALEDAGWFDERFFIYSEEPDLCLRIKRGGWQVRHMPQLAIVHHAGKGGVRPRMIAQDAYTRRQYASKYFSRSYRALYLAACRFHYLIRAAGARAAGAEAAPHREGALLALSTLAGRAEPPFGTPPPTAVDPFVNRVDSQDAMLDTAAAAAELR